MRNANAVALQVIANQGRTPNHDRNSPQQIGYCEEGCVHT